MPQMTLMQFGFSIVYHLSQSQAIQNDDEGHSSQSQTTQEYDDEGQLRQSQTSHMVQTSLSTIFAQQRMRDALMADLHDLIAHCDRVLNHEGEAAEAEPEAEPEAEAPTTTTTLKRKRGKGVGEPTNTNADADADDDVLDDWWFQHHRHCHRHRRCVATWHTPAPWSS